MKNIFLVLFSVLMVVFFLALVLTPTNDKNGNATKFFKYWGDAQYYQQNF